MLQVFLLKQVRSTAPSAILLLPSTGPVSHELESERIMMGQQMLQGRFNRLWLNFLRDLQKYRLVIVPRL